VLSFTHRRLVFLCRLLVTEAAAATGGGGGGGGGGGAAVSEMTVTPVAAPPKRQPVPALPPRSNSGASVTPIVSTEKIPVQILRHNFKHLKRRLEQRAEVEWRARLRLSRPLPPFLLTHALPVGFAFVPAYASDVSSLRRPLSGLPPPSLCLLPVKIWPIISVVESRM
jgi:hypothetical protein